MAESVSFDRVADVYDATRGGLTRGHRIARDIAPVLAPGITLEVGVGTGVVAHGLTELGHRVIGVDISQAMLAKAQERLGPVVARADASALPVSHGRVGNVVFVHVLHLVADMAAAIAEAARVLRPGGRLVALHTAPEPETDELSEVMAPVRQLRHTRPDDLDAVRGAGAAGGLHLLNTGWSAPAEIQESPNGVADMLDQRVFSWTWQLDDATWARTAEPVVAALRGLPDPDVPRRRVVRTRLTVWERPRIPSPA